MLLGRARVPQNAVLRSLGPEDFWTIRPFLRTVSFNAREIVQEQKKPIIHVDFVETGLISLRATAVGSVIETAILGSQGILGASAILGGRHAPHQAISLVGGNGLRITVEDLLSSIAKRPNIRDRILAYIEALLIHGSQTTLCAARHSMEQRLACWMCLASDAINGSVLTITHDDLSINLGLRRPSITVTLARFEAAGLIQKVRGALDILQRQKLEAIACCCYQVIAGSYRLGSQLKARDVPPALGTGGERPHDLDQLLRLNADVTRARE